MATLLHFASTILLGATTAIAVASVPETLNITVLSAQNNQSTLECWALEPGFVSSTQPGISGTAALTMGPVGANASYSILPAQFDGGRHNAPARQWVIFVSGLAHLTLPHSQDEAWIRGGKHGMILALDTADVSADGHYTTYPSDEVTAAVVVPLKNGDGDPGHRVLHKGACNAAELDF
ncbi:uncharacterized protein ACLA_049760 [Aspergillus clavatus NRRL 1]|uniref:Small secreted protein n=1 Tax=Aspergillus clavatus (strain ATCC 1007 / CBS 513.65 / DSM 816 / NCTC 3887 / NRRL 1 / QM 1276 / 107) TaxID=344612 RepID=A1CHZ9_ASPCL|nr:uncharacterized protein ACLA_049760 [Aspergillus clavatus NRRL 1]EAW10504.1 conserved hypothetical protein [Aspergillus clavatus NRRL 1]